MSIPKIALLHPTRGRAAQARATRADWLAKAVNPDCIEHIFGVDIGDNETLTAFNDLKHCVVPNPLGTVRALNLCFRVSTAPIVVFIADDLFACPRWDEIILRHIPDPSKQVVLAHKENHPMGRLICHPVATRERIIAQPNGDFMSDDYASVVSDNEFTFCAYRDKVVVDAPDLIFEHRHPSFGLAPTDSTYQHSNAAERFSKGREIYMQKFGAIIAGLPLECGSDLLTFPR